MPEDIDCHKPASWIQDALFQPEPCARYRAMLELGYVDAFRSLHPGIGGKFTFWDYFRQAFDHNRGIRIDRFLLAPNVSCLGSFMSSGSRPTGRASLLGGCPHFAICKILQQAN